MNFLGIGPFELLLILVIATVVLGPERMALAGRTLGRLYAQYRRRWQRDVDEMTRELRRELAMLQQELEDIRQTAEGELKTAQDALESAVDTQINLDAPVEDDRDSQPTREALEPEADVESSVQTQESVAPDPAPSASAGADEDVAGSVGSVNAEVKE